MIDKIMQYAIKLIFKLLWKNKNLRIDKVEEKNGVIMIDLIEITWFVIK